MHGDGHSGLHHNDGLLNVNGIFEERFDVILTNPPFGSRVEKHVKITEKDKYKNVEKIAYYKTKYGKAYETALNQINNNIGTSIVDLFDVGAFSSLTEVLFMERCLKLLKKGGGMGIVLPEGVLNNSNLQKVRDYFEGRAKILFIVSIPQDVFISAKATVKPSLLFMKKFTEEEEQNYAQIKVQIEKEVNKKYSPELSQIKESSKIAKEKKGFLKDIESKVKEEVNVMTKERFNYEIPIAEIKFAGISTTGMACENELIELATEFKDYFKENPHWQNHASVSYEYAVESGELIKRKV